MKPKTSFILIRIDNQEEEGEEGRTRKQLSAQRERERIPYFVSSFICLLVSICTSILVRAVLCLF
jgi:hypothetical protein